MSNAKLLKLLDEYASSFPFRPIEEQSLQRLLQQLDGKLSPLLQQVYRRIGRGAYFMTIPFFDFDADLQSTHELRDRLQNLAGYKATDRELVIGSATDEHLPTEPLVFFASDYANEDPDVVCLSTLENKVVAVKSLTDVMAGLRGFPDCKDVPQGLFDYYWYLKHFQIPPNHNPVQLSIQIMQWKTGGRAGMDERFLGHPLEGTEEGVSTPCVFSPFFYL